MEESKRFGFPLDALDMGKPWCRLPRRGGEAHSAKRCYAIATHLMAACEVLGNPLRVRTTPSSFLRDEESKGPAAIEASRRGLSYRERGGNVRRQRWAVPSEGTDAAKADHADEDQH